MIKYATTKKAVQKFIFSEFCPPTPFNTTQFLTEDYNLRMGDDSSSSAIYSLMQEGISTTSNNSDLSEDESLTTNATRNLCDALTTNFTHTSSPEKAIGEITSYLAAMSGKEQIAANHAGGSGSEGDDGGSSCNPNNEVERLIGSSISSVSSTIDRLSQINTGFPGIQALENVGTSMEGKLFSYFNWFRLCGCRHVR